jgi:hypothetical protein
VQQTGNTEIFDPIAQPFLQPSVMATSAISGHNFARFITTSLDESTDPLSSGSRLAPHQQDDEASCATLDELNQAVADLDSEIQAIKVCGGFIEVKASITWRTAPDSALKAFTLFLWTTLDLLGSGVQKTACELQRILRIIRGFSTASRQNRWTLRTGKRHGVASHSPRSMAYS